MRLTPPLGLLAMALPMLTTSAAAAATVTSVGDGDTLHVNDGGKRLTIRVASIDAPEMAQAPYGQQTWQSLQQLLPVSSTATLKYQTKDHYGRTVAEVFSADGRGVGLALVQQGSAFAYRQYLKQCDQWAYPDRERLAERYRVGGLEVRRRELASMGLEGCPAGWPEPDGTKTSTADEPPNYQRQSQIELSPAVVLRTRCILGVCSTAAEASAHLIGWLCRWGGV